MSLAKGIQAVGYRHHILLELGGLHSPIIIHEDNPPCTSWATEHFARNKNVDMCYHIFCKAAMREKAKLEYRLITEMTAEIVAKPLGLQKLS